MAFSKIEIEFNEVPEIDESVVFSETLLGLTFTEVFKTVRSAANQVKVPVNLGANPVPPHLPIYSGFASAYYKTAFNLDYNAGGLFTVVSTMGAFQSGLGKVTITANYPNAVFVAGVAPAETTVTITNVVSSPLFAFGDITFASAVGNECSHVEVTAATSNTAVNVLEPVVSMGNSGNPFIFDWMRGQVVNLKFQNASGTIITTQITTPSLLNAANFNLGINNSPYGATITVSAINSDGLEIEYSLDNSTWQTSNVYSGIAADNYTLFIRDQFGCSTSIDFAVNTVGIYNPFFYISKSNPIRFAQRIIWGDSANYKTDENTLSCEVDVKLPYKEIQQFQSADIITTQFKSNFGTNIAKVVKADTTEDSIPAVKMTSNIGVKDKRDAIKFNYGNGRTGIYFQSGNIYDFNSNAVVAPYALNGSLPYWAKSGNYMVIGSAWYLIEDIIFDEVRNCDAIVVVGIYTGVDAPVIVGSIFNFQEYEVYQFAIDMLTYLDQNIRVKIEASDSNFPTITYLSELINVKVRQQDTVEIRYRNKTNTDVFYSTGIEYKMRQLIQKVTGIAEQKQESNKTDTNVYLTSADVYEGDEFLFEPVTKAIMQMIVRALSHDILYINEVGYVKNDSVDVDGPMEQSNLYVIKAKMIKNGNVYNSQASGTGNQIFNGGNLNVPGLVDYGGGFVNY